MNKPWRQCAHGAGRLTGGAAFHYIPVGPLREGGRIVEVRLGMNTTIYTETYYGFFVCATADRTIENAQAGTPIIGWTSYRHFGLPVAGARCGQTHWVTVVLPCSVRIVGGGKWILCAVWHVSGLTHVLCSVTVEGVDRKMENGQGLGVEDGLDR